MKTKLLLLALVVGTTIAFAQSTINITTSGGSYPTEKWVSITTGVDGSGTQIWGQGNGTQCDGSGLINQDIMLPAGTYYVNCYDQYDDSWDGTLISVAAYGAIIGNNGGVTPDDGADDDVDFTCEGTPEELEASFQIVVPAPPSCLLPTAIANDAVTLTTADFSWVDASTEDAGYNWEVVPAGNAQGTGVVANGTTATDAVSASVTGLTAATDYDFYIQSNCGGSTSTWSAPLNFFTGYCASVPSSNDGNGIGQIDIEGTVLTSAGDVTYEDFRATQVAVDNSVTMNIEFQTGYTYDTNIWIDFNDDLVYDSSELVFDGVSGSADPTTLDTSFIIPGTVVAGVYSMRVGTADSGQATPDPCYNGSYGVTIDMVINFTPAACIDVSNIIIDSVTSDSIAVSWTENNVTPATDWEVVAVASGAGAPAVGTTNATSIPYTIGSLSPQTDYDVYVRVDCRTSFAGPVVATTACAPVASFPSTTDFTTNVPNACWDEAGDGEIATGPTGLGASNWKAGRAYTNYDDVVVNSNVINLYTQGFREWLISETYDLSALTTKVLTVEVAVTDYTFSGTSTATDTATMGADDSVDLLITTDGGSTWTSLETWNAANQPLVTGVRSTYDLASYSGNVQFAFMASDGLVDDPEDYDFHVGAFVVDSTAGLNDINESTTISLYPNPVSGNSMNVLVNNTTGDSLNATIYNTLGQQVLSRSIENLNGREFMVNGLDQLNSGLYILRITNGDQSFTQRFVKK